MIKFSSEKVKLLHLLMAEATGGSVGVRDEGLLDSASIRALQLFLPSKDTAQPHQKLQKHPLSLNQANLHPSRRRFRQ